MLNTLRTLEKARQFLKRQKKASPFLCLVESPSLLKHLLLPLVIPLIMVFLRLPLLPHLTLMLSFSIHLSFTYQSLLVCVKSLHAPSCVAAVNLFLQTLPLAFDDLLQCQPTSLLDQFSHEERRLRQKRS